MVDEDRHPTLNMIDAFLEKWPNAEWGPAHVVLSDYNLENEWLDSCMKSLEFAMQTIESGQHNGYLAERLDELFATLNFLQELKAIPESERFLRDA